MKLETKKDNGRQKDVGGESLPARLESDCIRLFGESLPARLESDWKRLFDRLWNGFGTDIAMPAAGSKFPALELSEDEAAVTVKAELPGMQPKDIDISVGEDSITIKGERKEEKEEKNEGRRYSERRYGRFERYLRLPSEVDADKVEAKYDQGVLTVNLPKSKTEKTRKVEVKG